jgi:hypothetical protein
MTLLGRTCRIPHVLALVLALVAVLGPARADLPPGEDAAIAAEVAAPLPAAPRDMPDNVPPARPRFWLGRFVDHLDLGNRLAALKTLKIMPIWDGRRLSVYFGVDHRGMPGLHVQQQDPAYAARAAAMTVPPGVLPPLRAVPLGVL